MENEHRQIEQTQITVPLIAGPHPVLERYFDKIDFVYFVTMFHEVVELRDC